MTIKRKSLLPKMFLLSLTTLLLGVGLILVVSAGPDLDLDLESVVGDGEFRSDSSNDAPAGKAAETDASPSAKDKPYTSPRLRLDDTYLLETFDDASSFKTNWIHSADPKYSEGKWAQSSGPDRPHADLQLVLPQKARHYAISSKLLKPFKFSDDKPLIVQYEVQFREGLDCGGAYVKLLRNSAINDLSKLTDKTPFTIMFGPDKCGSESKLHFIVQYLNPKTQEYSEKHWNQAKSVTNLMAAFSDKGHHLFRLELQPNNDFKIFLDDNLVANANLLEDLDPAINPPKEIVDVNDKMPADWDERPQIEDPDAKKPEDWDDDAPKQIEDPNATKPADWLEDEPQFIPDPEAVKPDDWDDQMDGEWEAPLVNNPKCSGVAGCGPWKAPLISNPNYRGKWKPAKIDNPNYKGKWEPRKIPNPDYYFEESPFKSLDAIGAISFELWSMADNVAFDNLIITSNLETAKTLSHLTWQEKKLQADASSPSMLTRALHYLKMHPWLWAVLILAIALPLFVFISYCCDTKKRGQADESARRKKTDESRPDTRRRKEQEEEAEKLIEDEEDVDEEEEDEEEEEGEDDDGEEEDEDKEAGDREAPKRQLRGQKGKKKN